MDPATRMNFEARAKILKAMAHATRLFLVQEVAGGEKCVCELQEKIGADMSTVSKHLSVLREAGVLGSTKRGNQVFYQLRCPCVLQFFTCLDSVLQTNANQLYELNGSERI